MREQNDGPTVTDIAGLFAGDVHTWHILQHGVDRLEEPHQGLHVFGFLDLCEWNGGGRPELADARASQLADMAFTVEVERQIPRHGAHIEALAGRHMDDRMIRIRHSNDISIEHIDFAGGEFELLPFPRKVISALAVNFDGGKFRRHLFNRADIALEKRLHLFTCRPRIRRGSHLAFGILALGRDAPPNGEDIFLLRVHRPLDGLGRFSESNRQDAIGQRIQRPAMTDLLGIVLALQDGNRLGGRDVDRFEQVEPPVDRVAFALSLTGQVSDLSGCAGTRFERGQRWVEKD